MIMIRIEQAEQALALLRMVHADIEAMHMPSEMYGPFETCEIFADGSVGIEWPNLMITCNHIEEFLDSLKGEQT
jgi:hypothetical protein